jgi:hypothetical protein
MIQQARGSRVHERWAHLRFSVIGQLLAAPPAKGDSSLAAATGQMPALRRADHKGNGMESSPRPSGRSKHCGHVTKRLTTRRSAAPQLPSTSPQSWIG